MKNDIIGKIKNGITITEYGSRFLHLTPVKVGSYCTFKEHDSIRIYHEGRTFYRNSNGAHGSVIDFVMEMKGVSQKEAIVHLGRCLGFDPNRLAQDYSRYSEIKTYQTEQRGIVFPERAENDRRAFAYLYTIPQ